VRGGRGGQRGGRRAAGFRGTWCRSAGHDSLLDTPASVYRPVGHATGLASLSVQHGHRLPVMPGESMNPEDCLRSLAADALLWVHPDRPLLPPSLGLMAVANADATPDVAVFPDGNMIAFAADANGNLETSWQTAPRSSWASWAVL
jgi:hypothetical protein